MEDLKVALVQTNLVWNDHQGNRSHLDRFLSSLEDQSVDLIVLPEMFSTGFTMQPEEHAEPHLGASYEWMLHWAKRLEVCIVGSISTHEEDQFVNRLYVVDANGYIAHYDKKHLFSYANEHQHYKAGDKHLVFELNGWKIMPLICYDLRFPVWSRNTMDYDALIYVANWPERRAYPWKTLLAARAIENMSYVVGVNRVGVDGNNIDHSGDSSVYDPLGELVWQAEPHKQSVGIINLSHEQLKKSRSRFGFLNDKDTFTLV